MPNAADIKLGTDASILLVGDGGTHKSFFIGTCPSPIYVFDTDKGMSIHTGRADIDYDTFREMPQGRELDKDAQVFNPAEGWYEWGTAWPAFLRKLNELGTTLDNGTCKYKTIAVDSLTMLTDIALSYILKTNRRTVPEIRDWGAFLSNMTSVFSQLTGWPLVKVLTAHIKRDENALTQTVEKLPLVPGQFAGKVAVLFDEVYYTDFKSDPIKSGEPARRMKWFLQTQPDGVIKQAKSRKYNVPSGTPTEFPAILKYIEAARGAK